MLTNQITSIDLLDVRNQMQPFVPAEVQPYLTAETAVWQIHFPVEKYPSQVRSLQLSQTPTYTGKLVGIKGQYLIFDDNTVFNVRGNEGTVVNLSII